MAAKRKSTKTSLKKSSKPPQTIVKSIDLIEKETTIPSSLPQKNLLKRLSRKQIILLCFIVVVALIYYFRSSFVVASVNGTFITRSEFNKEMENSIGAQTLDNLITKKLIFQEAAKNGVNVSDEDVNNEINKIKDLVETQGSTLEQALAMQGQTMNTLQESIRIQKIIEKILKDKIIVSDEELANYFDENSDIFGKDAKFEDVKDDIRQQLSQEKISAEAKTWIDNLKAEAKINYYKSF